MMCKERLVGLMTLVAGFGMLLLASPATGQDCRHGCYMQRAAAVTAARQAALACKQECRATTATGVARRECLKTCASIYRATQSANRAQHGGCQATCNPAPLQTPIDNTCLASCGRDLAGCAAQVIAGAASCLQACKTSSDPLTCVQGCAATAQGGVATCATVFSGCASACVPPPPTATPAPPPSACRDTCLTSAESCLGGLVNTGKNCVDSCAPAAYQAGMACFQQPDLGGCLAGVARQAAQCAQGCEATVGSAAQSCGATLNGCVQACPSDPCDDACIGSLESCAGVLATQGETCANSCATVALQAAAACLSQPDALVCLMGVGQQFGPCVNSCESTALGSGQTCKDSYLGCQQQCGP